MIDQPNGLQTIADRYGVSLDAVRHLIHALEGGNGTMAQFNHPDLGGFGQWSSGGMTMIGDMFNGQLKARVDGLCTELARSLPALGWTDAKSGGDSWWPAELGRPSTSGAQNSMRYAYFRENRRLVIDESGAVSIYDTGDHSINGVAQAQGGGQTLRFSGRDGPIDLETLRRIDGPAPKGSPERKPFEPEPLTPSSPPPVDMPRQDAAPLRGDDILGTIERLSDLHRKGVLTETEFAAKKADLLGRL
ncbi:SHOCT domain-containing protein [Methylobacterium sp. BTF04]|uniref:SHOCT domain-containing protein n=1 Tax=Methylobacterium sp. BTF04 TaxID=2708300 RepID=UPI0013D689EE|nr:SHOCT domain-containing protein [Methylobacterium sp. BTF04]NEU13094.1 SHOCT domain-containing protein [Methylobacterium sp. BTF04]